MRKTSLKDYLFKSKKQIVIDNYFKMLNGYSPVFTTYSGGLYEMDFPAYELREVPVTRQMADADWGYVGEGNHKVTISKGKTPVLKHIQDTEAVDRLVELIEKDQ